MAFPKGNKLAKGGKRKGSGRKPPEVKANLLKAQEIAREYIAKNIQPVLENYLQLSKGYTETRYTMIGTPYEVFVRDGATARHFIDKLVPAIKQEVEISGGLKIIKVNSFDPDDSK